MIRRFVWGAAHVEVFSFSAAIKRSQTLTLLARPLSTASASRPTFVGRREVAHRHLKLARAAKVVRSTRRPAKAAGICFMSVTDLQERGSPSSLDGVSISPIGLLVLFYPFNGVSQ